MAKGAAKKAHFDEVHGIKAEPKKETHGPEYVTMTEFTLVDNLRIMAFIAMCASCSLLGMGKHGMRASWRMRLPMARKAFRRSILRIVFIAICALIIRSYAKDSKRLVKQHYGIPLHNPHHKSHKNKKEKHHSRKL